MSTASEPSGETPPTPAPAAVPSTLEERYAAVMVPNYAPSLTFVRGKGCNVWDKDKNKYLDFSGGIAVNTLGHAHPAMLKALQRQASRLMHVSNLFYTEPQVTLAEKLVAHGIPDSKVLFCNSGAEANEALIKLARLWGHSHGGRFEIITFRNSFHGRTLATLTATGQTKVQHGFEPLPEGFVWADYNDLESVVGRINERTAAILVEPVQGEGGVCPADPEFLTGLRKLCDEHNLLLLCDEIQTGVGRTGKWFAWQHHDIVPDAVSLAKGLGGGFPIGAIQAGPKVADLFQPGTHGTTFGGNPLACAVANAVVKTLEDKYLVEKTAERGEWLIQRLQKLVDKHDWLVEVRGQGLMLGLVLNHPAAELQKILTRKGLITIPTAVNVLRMVPPLILSAKEARLALNVLRKTCQEYDVYAPENPDS